MKERLNESLLDLIRGEKEIDKFWRALARFRVNIDDGLHDLTEMAEHGSTLSMYFIGDIYLWGNCSRGWQKGLARRIEI